MKAIKIIIGVILSLLVLIVLVGLLLPQKVIMERSRTIDAPHALVFYQVNDLRNWEAWSPWHSIDTAMKSAYGGEVLGKGSTFSWTSTHKKVGSGKLTITNVSGMDTIWNEMDFGEQGLAKAWFVFKPKDDEVEVTWGFESDMGTNPIGRWAGLMIENMLEPQYEQGLRNLERVCISKDESPWFEVKVEEKPGKSYIGVTQTAETQGIGRLMGEMYALIMAELQANSQEATGVPFAIYHTWGKSVTFECGIPVKADGDAKWNKTEYKTLPASDYAILEFKGGYDSLEEGHGYIVAWIKKHGLTITGSPMEVYQTDPTNEPNPENWITYILYPVKP
jgi:effector-binding domain-containing protein